MSAYDRGSSDAEKQRLGAEAASACFKEMEDSLKKSSGTSSSSSSGSMVGPIILLLAIGGFVVYKMVTKGDKPLSPTEIRISREKMKDLYIFESGDSPGVREFKQSRLEEAEKMYELALSGKLPITANSMKGAIPLARQDLEDFKITDRRVIKARQDLLNATVEAKKTKIAGMQRLLDGEIVSRAAAITVIESLTELAEMDASGDSGEIDPSTTKQIEDMKENLARHDRTIQKYESELAELRA